MLCERVACGATRSHNTSNAHMHEVCLYLSVFKAAQFNVSIAHAHREGRLGIGRGTMNDFAIAHTEARAMPWALHDTIMYRALI